MKTKTQTSARNEKQNFSCHKSVALLSCPLFCVWVRARICAASPLWFQLHKTYRLVLSSAVGAGAQVFSQQRSGFPSEAILAFLPVCLCLYCPRLLQLPCVTGPSWLLHSFLCSAPFSQAVQEELLQSDSLPLPPQPLPTVATVPPGSSQLLGCITQHLMPCSLEVSGFAHSQYNPVTCELGTWVQYWWVPTEGLLCSLLQYENRQWEGSSFLVTCSLCLHFSSYLTIITCLNTVLRNVVYKLKALWKNMQH